MASPSDSLDEANAALLEMANRVYAQAPTEAVAALCEKVLMIAWVLLCTIDVTIVLFVLHHAQLQHITLRGEGQAAFEFAGGAVNSIPVGLAPLDDVPLSQMYKDLVREMVEVQGTLFPAGNSQAILDAVAEEVSHGSCAAHHDCGYPIAAGSKVLYETYISC